MKRRNIYWLVARGIPTALHKKKISALQKSHIGVWVVEDFSRLFQRFNERRSSTIIIGDEVAGNELQEGLAKISLHPEFVGVRFILSLTKPNTALTKKVMQLGFRDIIALDLDTKTWLHRFRFASLDQEKNLAPPVPQMTLRNISGIHIPSRIVWVAKNSLRFECRIKLAKGSKVRFRGGLADFVGAKWITLTILAHQRTNLLYRFSDAYTCHWEVPEELQMEKDHALETINNLNSDAPFKSFLAISNQNIRLELLRRLSALNLEVNVALHRKNIAIEPKFFNPDIIFLEDKLCTPKFEPLIKSMLENTQETTYVYIIGKNARSETFKTYQKSYPNPFFFLERFPPNFDDIIAKKLENKRQALTKRNIHYIPKNHPLSYGDLAVSSRLLKIHPLGVQLAVPFQIFNYALITIESPFIKSILNRLVAGKITSSHYHKNSELEYFPYVIDCQLSDLVADERQKLSNSMIVVFASHLDTAVPPLNQTKHSDHEPEPLSEPANQIPEDIMIENNVEASIAMEAKDIPITRIAPPKDTLGFFAMLLKNYKKYRRDIKILMIAIVAISLFYLLVFKYRSPVSEQGRIYSEQLLKFKERFQNKSQEP